MKKVNINKSGSFSVETEDCEVNPCISCEKFGYHSAKVVHIVEVVQIIKDFECKECKEYTTIEDPIKLLVNSYNNSTRKEFDKLFAFGVLKYER